MIVSKYILTVSTSILKVLGIVFFLFKSITSADARENQDSDLKPGFERLTVKQVVEVQRLHVEKKFQERVVNNLCKEKYTEKMFPDVCGPNAQWKKSSAAFLQFKNVNQSSEEKDLNTKNQNLATQDVSLPDRPKISLMYKITAVYGGSSGFQAEFKVSNGKRFTATVNDSIGSFMLTDINPEGIFMMSTEKKKNPQLFFSVGSRFK